MSPDWIPYLDTPAPAAAVEVEQAAARAQLPIPEDVFKLLLEHQGQVPVPGGVPLANAGSAPFGPILVVSPTAPDTTVYSYSVRYALEQINEWSPPSDGKQRFFPFASDTASGWYCLDQRDPAQPIIFIDLIYGPEENGAISLVAPNVTMLLAKLK